MLKTTILLALCSPLAALVLPPPAARLGGVTTAGHPAHPTRSANRAAISMQVTEAPVKIPDKVPNFAPANPDGQKAPQKGKKFKLLLFNDNVNK